MFRSQEKRVSVALQNAKDIETSVVKSNAGDASASVLNGLRKSQVVLVEDDIVVTEAGFVTMAIFPHASVIGEGMLAVPGVDDWGQQGYLVIRPNMPPYHSLNLDPLGAIREAQASVCKSNELLAAFGNKSVMMKAVTNAPALLPSTVADFESSGLCLWGAESFLRRLGMLAFARRFGLPRFLLKLSGPYGVRLTAATLIRRGLWKNQEFSAEIV